MNVLAMFRTRSLSGHLLAVLLLILLNSELLAGGIAPNMVPNQDQALDQAEAFLTDLERGDFESAFDRLAEQTRIYGGYMEFFERAQMTTLQLGGPSYDRFLIEAYPVSFVRGFPDEGTYLELRFRSIHPRGTVYQDVTLQLERNDWRIIGFWTSID